MKFGMVTREDRRKGGAAFYLGIEVLNFMPKSESETCLEMLL